MLCNPSKTEFIVFGSQEPDPEVEITLGDTKLKPQNTMKVLGVIFDDQLNWRAQVTKILAKCSSISCSLRVLNNILPRDLNRQVIHAHFISHLVYGSPIWSGCISQKSMARLSSCLNKTLRLHCFDFKRSLTNHEICNLSKIRSFKSLALIHDAKTLYRLVTQCANFNLVQRLSSQSLFYARYPNRISFVDYGKRRVARNSFINRAKRICESIPFDWIDMKQSTFEISLKRAVPLYVP